MLLGRDENPAPFFVFLSEGGYFRHNLKRVIHLALVPEVNMVSAAFWKILQLKVCQIS